MGFLRSTTEIEVTIANGAALSGEFSLAYYSGGNVFTPAAWTAASIGFYVYSSLIDDWVPLNDKVGANVLVTNVVVDEAFALPSEVFAVRRVKLWSNDGAGSNTNQGASRTLLIEMKS